MAARADPRETPNVAPSVEGTGDTDDSSDGQLITDAQPEFVVGVDGSTTTCVAIVEAFPGATSWT